MSNKQIKLEKIDEKEILYHYTKSNGINGIINNNCFWATKSDFLNDPNEFLYITDIIKEVCGAVIESNELREMFLGDVLERSDILTGGKNKEFFVLSFSHCKDSITMWSEFGNKTGYNIGLNSNEIIKRIEEYNVVEYHGLVVYNPRVQYQLLMNIYESYLPRVSDSSLEDILINAFIDKNNEVYKRVCRKFQRIISIYAMFFKNESFSLEEEYRFVFKKQKNTNVRFREKDGFLIPYIEIPISEKKLPIREIVVAPQNHIDLAKNGIEYMLKNKGYDVNVELSNIKLRY